jgi:hypothetical protein
VQRAFRFAIVILFFAHPALAQSRVFVGANLFADTKTFSGDPSPNSLNGTALGGSVDGGVTLNDHFSLRINVGMGGKTTGSTPIPIGVLAPVLARVTVSITSFRSDVTNRLVSTSILIGYQFPVHESAIIRDSEMRSSIVHLRRRGWVGGIRRRPRLSGLLNYYYRAARPSRGRPDVRPGSGT